MRIRLLLYLVCSSFVVDAVPGRTMLEEVPCEDDTSAIDCTEHTFDDCRDPHLGNTLKINCPKLCDTCCANRGSGCKPVYCNAKYYKDTAWYDCGRQCGYCDGSKRIIEARCADNIDFDCSKVNMTMCDDPEISLNCRKTCDKCCYDKSDCKSKHCSMTHLKKRAPFDCARTCGFCIPIP